VTLTEFLNARLDDDEAGVRMMMATEARDHMTNRFYGSNLAERMLREVAAKRAILALHEPVPFWGNNPPSRAQQTRDNVRAWYCECQCLDGVIEGEWPCGTVRALVSVYSDHEDFNEEWKP
jgi:hypothetical protein